MSLRVLCARVVMMVAGDGVFVRVRRRAGVVGVDLELRRRHTRAQHAIGVNVHAREGETAQRLLQFPERKARVEERAERHVARNPGEAIEVENLHERPAAAARCIVQV